MSASVNVPLIGPNRFWAREIPLVLSRLGFRLAEGTFGWRRDSLVVRTRGHWLVLGKSVENSSSAPLVDHFARPGLWRRTFLDREAWDVFELPLSSGLISSEEGQLETEFIDPLEACLAWADGTTGACPIDDLKSPPVESIQEHIPHSDLTVVQDTIVRQIVVDHAELRLSLRVPLLPCWPDGLPEERLHWLAAFLSEARPRFPMARLGFQQDGSTGGVWAEVNLTGAPRACLDFLISAGLTALRRAVFGLAETVELLADATLASEILATFPETTPQPRKENAYDCAD